MSTPETLQHYINGQRVSGTSGRFSDVFNPALGILKARVPLASQEEVAKAIAAAKDAFPKWAATPPLRRARIMAKFRSSASRTTRRSPRIITSEHGKVHDDAMGEVTRGVEVVEFATRRAATAQGRGDRERRHQRRQSLAPTAARRRRRHHAVQLSGDGADVDVPGRHRLRQHVHPEAVRARSVGVDARRGPLQAGRTTRRRLQRRPWRQGRGGRALDES